MTPLHEASRTGKSLEKETRLVVAKGLGRGEWGVITDGNRLPLEDEKLWRQDRGGGCQPLKVLNETIPLKPRLGHSETVNSTLCEFQCSQQTKRKQR